MTMQSGAELHPPCDDWLDVSDPRFEVRFRYPAVTPRGEPVERQESQEGEALRIHVLSAGREVYFEVRRYPPLTGEEEYRRHATHLRGRFADLILSELTETHLGPRPAQAYTFAWDGHERAVLVLRTSGATYHVIYDPRAPLNHHILATLEVQDSTGECEYAL